MLLNGYRQSQGDHTLFFKHSDSGEVRILLVYVNDIILTGNNEEEKASLRKSLTKEFDIKELGRPKYFLGSEVAHSSKGIFISQQKYIKDLLRETGKLACKPASTPVEPNLKLGEAKKDPDVDKVAY
ncbi:putative mitochondrial protein [Dendrobium catenatum]|uniref:Putative mitochondrial protein n=1 Tax=Dendrobium catenatum TaxID=906689 RepID=A0A2I0X9E7_9ASPA|nr:putative mitochondrial protein [Dendrobium catenatum]